jgi:hypothetical protein
MIIEPGKLVLRRRADAFMQGERTLTVVYDAVSAL